MMVTRRSAVLAAIAVSLACLLTHRPARGAPPSAVISGLVADFAGNPLAGASVTLSGDGIGINRVSTDARGRYRFPGVEPRHVCSVAADHAGFRSVIYEGMLTEAGRTRLVNFRLKRPGQLDVTALVTRDPFP